MGKKTVKTAESRGSTERESGHSEKVKKPMWVVFFLCRQQDPKEGGFGRTKDFGKKTPQRGNQQTGLSKRHNGIGIFKNGPK